MTCEESLSEAKDAWAEFSRLVYEKDGTLMVKADERKAILEISTTEMAIAAYNKMARLLTRRPR